MKTLRGRAEPGLVQTLEAVREVRAHLRTTFPLVDHVAVHRILASHGIDHYPDALMLAQPKNIAMPRRTFWRRRQPPAVRLLRKGRPLLYFSEPYYRLGNPDLRDLDIPMVLHWQVHGRCEGRSPHPFIDVGWLTEQIPDALPAEVVDVYLTDRTRWLVSPSPYVEIESFMLFGPWDGTTHPLLQIIRDYPVEPWLRGRLGVIDLAEAGDDLHMAAGVLTARNPGLAQLSAFSLFEPSGMEGLHLAGPASFRVVPGFVLALDHHLISSPVADVMSEDGTAVRVGDRVLVLDTRDSVRCDTLVFVTSELDEVAIERLAQDSDPGTTLVAPFDAAQQEAFERLGVTTLQHSRQVAVDAASFELVGGPS